MKTFGLLIMVVLLFACGERETGTYTIEYVDGVRYIHNHAPLWSDEQKLSIELIHTIGGLDSNDENYILFVPTDVAVDQEGALYVLDSGNARIQKYDKNRKFMMTIGRKGQGPGEFLTPVSFVLDDSEILYFVDQSKKSVLIFDTTGKQIDQFQLNRIPISWIELTYQSNILLTGQNKYNLFSVYDVQGNKINSFGQVTQFSDRMLQSLGNKIDFTVDNTGNIYAAYEYRNRIDKYSPIGKRIQSIDRPLNYEVTEKINIQRTTIKGAVLMLPKINSVSQGICIDSKRRIWVVSYIRQESVDEKVIVNFPGVYKEGFTSNITRIGNTEAIGSDIFKIEIFSSDGILQEDIPLNTYCDNIRIFKDRLYIVDSSHYMAVYEYKIIDLED